MAKREAAAESFQVIDGAQPFLELAAEFRICQEVFYACESFYDSVPVLQREE